MDELIQKKAVEMIRGILTSRRIETLKVLRFTDFSFTVQTGGVSLTAAYILSLENALVKNRHQRRKELYMLSRESQTFDAVPNPSFACNLKQLLGS